MMTVITSMMMMTTVSAMLMMICSLISTKSIMDREKTSPFECGFDPKSSPRMPFSIHFFLIAILFLIFDVEIVIIMPIIITVKYANLMTWTLTTFTFIIVLIAGLFHEWNNGILEWTK
uniref:NADH-ubiquinone oxidoreductase chain 3 n=1 Tax=Leptopus sp. NKMT019 TaxID=575850 RepID=C5HIQ6_9HEMI|nr:NADH dehydrogenase subunit 3 [Leptopus sp. NKMT019]